jgi:uncharacterized protein YkwD
MLRDWFLPQNETHQKAHLLSWHGLVIFILTFILIHTSFQIIGYSKPGILGTTSSITEQQVIALTNSERAKLGLGSVSENPALDQAAKAKAANMFSENYWAHFAPSGKSPWDFMKSSGYTFTYAGENLAKNFSKSDDVVVAWMNSPSHRENIVNPKYKDIGIAVEDGILNGQQTTLVVQMFGTTDNLAVLPDIKTASTVSHALTDISNVAPAQTQVKPLFDPFKATKITGVAFMLIVVLLLVVDFMILRRRGVYRVSSHNLAHVIILIVTAITVILAVSGNIL